MPRPLEGEAVINDRKPPEEGTVPGRPLPWGQEVCTAHSLPPVAVHLRLHFVGICTLNIRDKNGA